jgi:hypothetical protein
MRHFILLVLFMKCDVWFSFGLSCFFDVYYREHDVLIRDCKYRNPLLSSTHDFLHIFTLICSHSASFMPHQTEPRPPSRVSTPVSLTSTLFQTTPSKPKPKPSGRAQAHQFDTPCVMRGSLRIVPRFLAFSISDVRCDVMGLSGLWGVIFGKW